MNRSLIINSPYTEPDSHWTFTEEGVPPTETRERRAAGYMVSNPNVPPHRDRGSFVPIPLVNEIRPLVAEWREAGYSGVTAVTKALLDHWNDAEQRENRFFFCQLEAIETLIWLAEAPQAERFKIKATAGSGEFSRLCCKLATGTGKTVVMAMLIAWQAINKAARPDDARFAKNFLIIAPGLTVRNRLSVLRFSEAKSYYEEFDIVPASLRGKLAQGKVLIQNWHALNWQSEEKIKKKKSVDKRGAKSDEAYAREVLGDMAGARDFVVINDEAHHAWRFNENAPDAASLRRGEMKESAEAATIWVGGLDRLHRTRGILQCFDFSATPYAPSGRGAQDQKLFGWIVSDFGLNDAIESGLVKTPRMVVGDDAVPDARTYKSRLYHIYNDEEVKSDFNRKAEAHEALPDLVMNAYMLLGADWQRTKKEWSKSVTPPVMITVANRTETAARIKFAFDKKRIMIEPLCDPDGILHIDSKALSDAEAEESDAWRNGAESGEGGAAPKPTKKGQAALLREKVNTVGQEGKPGARVQNVISVGMLSEGWDARTVTQIMGLRAFTSQLLCEQVIGRGLRRASYEINPKTNQFDAEYVNVFGVPFRYLPHEDSAGSPPPPPEKITVQPVDEQKQFAISWPNIIRIDRTHSRRLSLDLERVKPLQLDTSRTVQIAALAPELPGGPDVSQIRDVDLEKLLKNQRRQTLIFKAAQEVYNEMKPNWPASPAALMAQLVQLAERFITSGRIDIVPALFNQNEKRRQLVITLNMAKVIRHFWQAVSFQNTESFTPVFDEAHPIRATGDMRAWRTGKPCQRTKKSHINYCVFDSAWEASEASHLDRSSAVEAWVKNDHLGFEVLYVHNGVVKKYRPDFLIRLQSGATLILEVKGRKRERDSTKHDYMRDWVEAVNQHGGFGRWCFDVSEMPADVADIINRHNRETPPVNQTSPSA
ncbi:MAG: DEAD/DEAH box helicase family protein [Gammaproteobacteria bacterium]|nr:DEAD/DEAH box helicase family protein [Gammaproteobacteria bacterium]MDA7961070.1 DEAD/DEAH box helicase family protein [Gammaproteobacteria bacterium]MDA7972432.1 DEAD/DEAH box helicase family protein [Gammaproteobacteria bacterium]MDA8023209.1 DEAD/DEAH box helicase family protein [Gammaproteobacteria bacterium]